MSARSIPVVLLLLTESLCAQQGGFIEGSVRNRSGAVVAGAEIRIQNQDTGVHQRLYCDVTGKYFSTELPVGAYRVTVRSEGFRTSSHADLNVLAGKTLRLDLTIDVLPLRQEMTVTATESDVDPTASGLTISRDSPAASLPENGRDVHALFDIMPGATVTPASLSAGGQFTVSGQRPNTNSFRVDGVSGNVGLGIPSVPGAALGATLPGMTTVGGLQSLASKEETERVELRSADFAAQFGERPGAQINIETRAGSNEFHGSLFGYIRPHFLNSEDWFARGSGLNLPSAFLDGWGGALGGPLGHHHTYFFASFERTGVKDIAVEAIPVPSPEARALAGAAYQFLFNAFPQPVGRQLNADNSLAFSPLQNDARFTNQSIRLDQTIGSHAQAFARYSDVPSSSTNQDLGSAYSTFHWTSTTAGLNLTTGDFVHEFRFNYSNVVAKSQQLGSTTPSIDSIISGGLGILVSEFDVSRLSIEGAGQVISGAPGNYGEDQFAGDYTVSRRAGRHELKAGFNYGTITLNSINLTPLSSVSIVSPGIEALLAGIPLGLTYASGTTPGGTIERYSTFLQDTIRVTDRLRVLLGIRWDMTPTVSASSFDPAYFDVGYWNGSGTQSVFLPENYTSTVSSWPTRYGQVSPRFGLAYHLKFPDVVLRVGAGLFYDTGLGSILTNTNPLNIWQYVPNSAAPVYPSSSNNSIAPVLYSPQVWEWRTSLEKSFRESSLLSVSYFGSAGRRLLRNEGTVDPQSGIIETLAFTTEGNSNYNALVVQLRANLTKHLFALASYTWGHSIDTGSSEASPILADGPSNKGSSDFDVRHSLNASLSYRVPERAGLILRGWSLSSTLLARTGFPFDVTTVDQTIGLGFDNADRVNVVADQPLWITNATAPGGRELNPAAFQMPANGAIGTLGRNALTGPGVFQLDASMRRQFRLYKGVSVETVVSAFNLPNHPSFANPVGYLGSALFGQSTSTTNLMLGTGSPTTGLTPLFQAGGARTIEMTLRFSF